MRGKKLLAQEHAPDSQTNHNKIKYLYVISEKAASASRTFSERVARKNREALAEAGSRFKFRWLFDVDVTSIQKATQTRSEIPAALGRLGFTSPLVR